jgi:hypothetical protein
MDAETTQVQLSIRVRIENLKSGLPGFGENATINVVAGLEGVKTEDGRPLFPAPDSLALSQATLPDLETMAEQCGPAGAHADVIRLNAICRELRFRADSHRDASAARTATRLGQKLERLAAALPQIQKRREQYDALVWADASLTETRQAIAAGGAL